VSKTGKLVTLTVVYFIYFLINFVATKSVKRAPADLINDKISCALGLEKGLKHKLILFLAQHNA
jgi:hypothetical protein